MNVIKHRKYIVEFDIWEPQLVKAEAEYDAVIGLLKASTHLGNVKVHLETEDKTNG